MFDPFVRQLILKYHQKGHTDIEIAVITGQPVSKVSSYLQGLKQKPTQIEPEYRTNTKAQPHSLAKHAKNSSPDTISQSKNNALAAKSVNHTQSPSNDKLPIQDSTRSPRNNLLEHQSLILRLLEETNYNCSAVYRELTAQGIKTQLRTVQRFCQPFIQEHENLVSHKLICEFIEPNTSLAATSTAAKDKVSSTAKTPTKSPTTSNKASTRASHQDRTTSTKVPAPISTPPEQNLSPQPLPILEQDQFAQQISSDEVSGAEKIAFSATVLKNNLVTIPKSIRQILKLSPNDKVVFVYYKGQVVLCKQPELEN